MSAVNAATSAGVNTGGLPNVGGWHPTILYLAGLVLVEIIAVGLITRMFLR